jgi:hypothetical protein
MRSKNAPKTTVWLRTPPPSKHLPSRPPPPHALLKRSPHPIMAGTVPSASNTASTRPMAVSSRFRVPSPNGLIDETLRANGIIPSIIFSCREKRTPYLVNSALWKSSANHSMAMKFLLVPRIPPLLTPKTFLFLSLYAPEGGQATAHAQKQHRHHQMPLPTMIFCRKAVLLAELTFFILGSLIPAIT